MAVSAARVVATIARYKTIARTTGMGIFVLLLLRFRISVLRFLDFTSPGGTWRVLTLLLALFNLKSLPLGWHVRLLGTWINQLSRKTYPPPSSLFETMIMTSRTPLAECDFNMHKSNSTYFSDLDIARQHHLAFLLRRTFFESGNLIQLAEAYRNGAIKHLGTPNGVVASSSRKSAASEIFSIMLGAVSCHFHREIPPYARFEIWTRLLSWDQKWMYTVSHFVQPGTAKPAKGDGQQTDQEKERLRRAVYATSIGRMVMKRGRLTVPPELVLQAAGLLPARPADGDSEDLGGKISDADYGGANTKIGGKTPSWQDCEAKRLEGLHYARMFTELGDLANAFDGDQENILGKFADLLAW